MDLDKLEQLELQVERLVEQNQRMKKAKARAETRLQERDAQCKSLSDRIRRYERERAALRERLTKIIGRFEHLDLS
jgi:predicted nuclease with TOPRIM domain